MMAVMETTTPAMNIARRRRLGGLLAALVIAVGAAAVFAQDGAATKDAGAVGKEEKAPKKSRARKKTDDKTDLLRELGELTNADPFDRVRTGCRAKTYEVKMGPGKSYLIRMFDQNGPAVGSMDPYLRLENSKGANLAQDDDSEGNLNARIVFNPAVEDTYRVIATTLPTGRTGKFLLTVEAFSPGMVPPPSFASGGFAPNVGLTQNVVPPPPARVGDLTIAAVVHGLRQSPRGGPANLDTHGYVEYAFTIENGSETQSHQVTVIVPSQRYGRRGMGHYLQELRKSVEVLAGATAHISVFQPDLLIPHDDVADIEIDGRLSDKRVPMQLVAERGTRTGAGMYYGFGSSMPALPGVSILAPSNDAQRLQNHLNKPAGAAFSIALQAGANDVAAWSSHWLGYTSFDGVVLEGAQLQAAPAEVQTALTQFVECGGSLLVFGAYKPPDAWQRTKSEPFKGFTRYNPGFGTCLVGAPPIERWTNDDWKLVRDMWLDASRAWRQIVSPTEANVALPIVDDPGIPVRGLFIVMVGFVVLIGPVNVYWLGRARRRIWLLWTVPIFAVLTCVLLVGYMLLSEGWHGHVRTTCITVLDENSQRASTIGWLGYYCPTTPIGGLHFNLETELSPHLNFRGARPSNLRQPHWIDWTRDEHLTDGWITAKVPAHFLIRRADKRPERLSLRGEGEGMQIVNGLGARLTKVWLARKDGGIVTCEGLEPGASAALQPTALKANGDELVLSEVFAGPWLHEATELASNPAEYLRPGCYIAVLDDAPFVDLGLQQTQSRKLRTIVYGILKESP